MAKLALGVHGAEIALHSPALVRFVKMAGKRAREKWERSSPHSRAFSLESWQEISKPCKSQEEILRWAFAPEEYSSARAA